MLYSHFNQNLLGLEDVLIKNIKQNNNLIEINIELNKKEHICPSCKQITANIHDYRIQTVKDIPAFGKSIVLKLRKRRYRCRCGKRFNESNRFLPSYYRRTGRLSQYIIKRLGNVCSFKSVAKELNLSPSTITRTFDLVSYTKRKLPSVLSIDEFKGNTWGEKYQCILTDPVNKIIIDILPQRYKDSLIPYFRNMPREQVTHFVSDMWTPYYDIAKTEFKKATFIVDKFHFIRQVIWAFDAVRKEEQRKFHPTRRKYFKHSRRLLMRKFKFLKDEEKQAVNIMLYASPNILTAHTLKEDFFKLMNSKNKKSAKKRLKSWVINAQNSGLKKFIACAKTMINWTEGITNSFSFPYTNGFTEGINNKIKVLKRNAYGYKNFARFRNRILHIFNNTQDPT
jgi:Transposase and inactivated derivatives